MNHIFFSEIEKTFKNILDDRFSPILIKTTVFSQSRLKISFITEFSDDVAIAVTCENLMAFEDIGVAELFKYINFRKKQFFKLFALERL